MGSTVKVTWLRPLFRAGLVILAVLVLPGLLEASLGTPLPTDGRAERHYAAVRTHLEQDAGYGELLGLPVTGWKLVALSSMATGLMSMAVDARQRGDEAQLEELAWLLGEVARRALDPANSPYDVPLDEVEDFNDWGAYLGHVSLVLGCHRYVAGETERDRLHRRIVRYQLDRMAADGDQHARSYPNSYKWPADQAVTLAGIHLYDRIHSTHLSVRPITDWLAAVSARSSGGLHPLTLTEEHTLPLRPDGQRLPPLDSATVPRGSALSPTAFYMAQFAPREAAALYGAYREARWTHRLGLGGFREWPVGSPGGWDLEGGPVLSGLGSLATVQGLAAASVFDDDAAASSILGTTLVTLVPVGWSRRQHLLAPLLVEAWLFNGVVARPWFEPPPTVPEASSAPPLPLGAGLLLLVDLALLAGLIVPPLLRLRRERAREAPPVIEDVV
jgi:hypothetical protein